MVYTDAFKRNIVQRLLAPGAPSATALCKEVRIPQSTLSRWLRRASTLGLVPSDKTASPPGSPARSAPDKLRLLVAFEALPDAERGAWLRQQGLHEAEVAQWRQTLVDALDEPRSEAAAKNAVQSKRIRQLERELQRKEKALAEAAALLILQKKIRSLWEVEDGDTPDRSEP